MTARKGFFTPEQEKKLDYAIKLKGAAEALDGPVIQLTDDQGLERLKAKLEEKFPGASEFVYEIIDVIMELLPEEK